MPRWLWTIIILVVIFAFIIPDPAAAGAAVGNAVDALITFFRSIASSIST
jgi:hypothetical protein